MTTVDWQMTMKVEYKALQIWKKGNNYLMNLANPAKIKICVKRVLSSIAESTKFRKIIAWRSHKNKLA